MHIQPPFREKILAVFGDAGETYLDRLEDIVTRYARDWNLTVGGPVPNLSYNYVLFVTCADGTPAVLKISVPTEDNLYEIRTTMEYEGKGCAALLMAAPEDGVQLIEQLQPGMMLTAVRDEMVSVERFCDVWQMIRRPLPAGAAFRNVSEMGAMAFRKYRGTHPDGGPISLRHIFLAENCFRWLDEYGAAELLHGDLHHQNILYDAGRGWMAIDPHGYAGDPACDLAPFLYNRLDGKQLEETLALRSSILLGRLQVSHERFLRACIAMTVMSACWNAEEGNLLAIELENRITDWYISELDKVE